MRLVLALCLALMAPPTARATELPLELLETGLQARGWEAVGRIDIGTKGFCTGALISERVVLTAAHCLFDRGTRTRIPDDQLLFRAGWRNGRAAAEARVQRSAVHPRYTPTPEADINIVAHDLALLELSRPIRTSRVTPFEVLGEPRSGDQVGVVSYGEGRSEVPALQERCEVLQRDGQGVLAMSCGIDFGSSGAPVFAIRHGQAKIVSVVSAKGTGFVNGARRDISFGVSLGARLDELRVALASGDGRFIRAPDAGSDGPRVMSGGGGARFVRP